MKLCAFVFTLVCRRYEKKAMVWTSSKGLADWASAFAGDEVLTAANLDRPLHHGAVVNIRGRSKLQAALVARPKGPAPGLTEGGIAPMT